MSEGLDLSKLDEISPEEVNAHLIRVWSWRGPLYEMYANSLMLDYAPDFAKLHRWGSNLFGRPSHVNIITLSMQNIHSYMMFGWETGILNEFITLRRNGMPLSQLMELVMFSQLYAGMRGLGHVYRAVGDLLPVFGEPPVAVEFPEGWAADPDAFKCGLDFSTREMTDADLANLTGWYERTIGYVPNSIKFGLKHNPQFVKVNRAKWEVALEDAAQAGRAVPDAAPPHRSPARAKACARRRCWPKPGASPPSGSSRASPGTAMYFTGFEGLYAAYDAVDDLL